jgi:hypothetical protein
MWMPDAGTDDLVTQGRPIDHVFPMGAIEGSGASSA